MIYIFLFIIFLSILLLLTLFQKKITFPKITPNALITTPSLENTTTDIQENFTTEIIDNDINESENTTNYENILPSLPLALLPLVSPTLNTTSTPQPQQEIIDNVESTTATTQNSSSQNTRRKKALLTVKSKQSPRHRKYYK